MRRAPLILLSVFLAACGSSAAVARPTPTPAIGYTDPHSHVSAVVKRKVLTHRYALLYVSLHNGGRSTYQVPLTPFIDDALVEPNSPGTIGSCDFDSSRGPGLDYVSLPAGATHTGWIRCDYPGGSHVVAVFWLRNQIAGYRIP